MSRTLTDAVRGVASLALLTTVLAACGSSAEAATTGGGPAPSASQAAPAGTATPTPARGGSLDLDGPSGLCAIYPSDRAAAALGEPVGPAKATRSTVFANASCQYGSTVSDGSVAIWYHYRLTRADWEESVAKVGMTKAMAVEGIGEAAYRQDGSASHPRVKLTAFQGDHAIWVILTRPADLGTLAMSAEREARALLAAIA